MRRIRKLMKQLHVPSSPQLDQKIHDEISGALAKSQSEISPDGLGALLWRVSQRIAPLVGCLLLGFIIGGWFFRNTTAIQISTGATGIVRQAKVQRKAPAEADTSKFWSRRRLYERALRITPKRSARIMWHSPLMKRKIGDAI